MENNRLVLTIDGKEVEYRILINVVDMEGKNYVVYTNDKKIHDMEKRLLKYIKKHEIVDKFIYLNVTDELESEKYIKSLKKIFSSVKEDIEKAPMLIYVKNGIAVEVIKSKNGMLYTYDVQSLNEEYGLE